MVEPLHRGSIIASVILILTTASISSPVAAPSTQDGEALLDFKRSIKKDVNGALSAWKPGTDYCRWPGVSCSSGRVTKVNLPRSGLAAGDGVRTDSIASLSLLEMLSFLDLSDNDLFINATSLLRLSPGMIQLDLAGAGVNGPIPGGFLSHFSGIAYVDLSRNNLTGLLPNDVLAAADELQILDLSDNNLSGDVSALSTTNSCKSLLHFDISGNYFGGLVPPSLSNCKRLKTLNFSDNDFAGAIPDSYTSFTGLQQLDISHNHVSGVIPPAIGDCCGSLVQLWLSDNNISGEIPLSLSACSSLVVLDLANNNISGDFPDSILGRLTSLQKLFVGNNFITGPLPPSLSLCPALKIADFSSNRISGSLPANLCPGASSLEELRAPDNLLVGQIPVELALCSQLKTIDFSINKLTGAIPRELGSLVNLESLMVWFNGLSGSIPPELGRCGKLKNLILNNNFLSGSIPPELFQCRNLEWLSLTSNRMVGQISPAFGTLMRLAILQLANNSFYGGIPAELGNCSSMVWLDLNNNRLTGRIPVKLGRQVGEETPIGILSGNTIAFVRNVGSSCKSVGGLLEFAGIKPERLLQVPALKSCDFTRLYSGAALSDWSNFRSLEYLDLSYNELEGEIPAEFGDMAVLQVLDVTHNRLSGEIPATIGKLTNLGVFDVSHNKLRGSIPDTFSNLSFLVQVDFSDNSLDGPIPSRGQLSTLPASQFANNLGLCGVPLSPCGTHPPSPATTTARKTKRAVPWASSTIVLAAMATLAILCVIAVWGITVRSRRREARAARILSSLTAPGGRSATHWKLGRENEPLSINVATFQRQLRRLTFAVLVEATNGFSADALIGAGGFGEVFKATLKDGTSVAVKKLVRLSSQGDREFTAEMETLGKIKHRHLVPLLGYCKVGEERLLVYEYMPFGSLEDLLHTTKPTKPLSWHQRKMIARGAAKGLCFLHHNCIPHIIHRDMKSSNVLLDKNMEARVSDFGMARLINALDTHLSVSTLAGTPGYVPPEYYQSFRCTAKGDVYSYGVVVLELLTGRRPTEKGEEFGDTNLVGWVKGMVREGREGEVLDAEMVAAAAREGEVEEMGRCLEIAVRCVDDFPSRRPNMLQVVAMLRELVSFPGDGDAGAGDDLR